MPTQQEGAWVLHVPAPWRLERLDGPDHCASHAFKAVDFLVAPPAASGEAEWLAVELKGAELPCARHFDRARYLEQLKSAAFVTELVDKFRATWLYLWLVQGAAAERLRNFLVLLVLPPEVPEVESPLLLALTDHLRQRLPEGVPARCRERWRRALVRKVWVVTPAAWARAKPPSWAPITFSSAPCP